MTKPNGLQTLVNNYNIENGIESSSLPPQKVLFIFAHPDDEQWQVGTIKQLIDNGHIVYVAYSTSGKYGTDVRGIITDPTELATAREIEAATSLNSIGVPVERVIALRLDDSPNSINVIFQNLLTDLSIKGVTMDCVISFDDIGVYNKDDHITCGFVASRMYLEGHTNRLIRFTVPKSDYDQINDVDITKLNNTGTSYAPSDSVVGLYYDLTPSQITAKQGVIDIHVTQFDTATADLLKTHYNIRPYEYFVTSFDRLEKDRLSNSKYLTELLGV